MQTFLTEWPIERIEAAGFLALVALVYAKTIIHAFKRR